MLHEHSAPWQESHHRQKGGLAWWRHLDTVSKNAWISILAPWNTQEWAKLWSKHCMSNSISQETIIITWFPAPIPLYSRNNFKLSASPLDSPVIKTEYVDQFSNRDQPRHRLPPELNGGITRVQHQTAVANVQLWHLSPDLDPCLFLQQFLGLVQTMFDKVEQFLRVAGMVPWS